MDNKQVSLNSEMIENLLRRYEKLSTREKEIAQKLAQNKSSENIKNELFISIHTVDCHRRNILRKLDITNTACLSFLEFK